MFRIHGKLDLSFTRSADRTLMRVNHQQPPLKVVRAFPLPDAAALVHLHSVSGGVLGGDRLDLAVEVGTEARVQITTTSATRLYRSRDSAAPAWQTTDVTLHQGSLLEYLPDSLIPFAGSRYQQHTRINLNEDAGLFWWEVVAPGREARGEVFSYDVLRLHMDIVAGGSPIVRERFHLRPAQQDMTSRVRMGDYRYMGTFYICKVGEAASRWTSLEAHLQEIAKARTLHGAALWGVSCLPAHGLVIRALSNREHTIYEGLHHFWREAKQTLFGRPAILPRKIY